MKAKPPRFVLDSFAVLAYLQKEAGGQRVAEILGRARRLQAEVYLCLVNFGEVAYIIERKKGPTAAQDAIAALDQLPVTLVAADRTLTLAAAHLKAHHSLAYADAFTVALAIHKEATLVTADPEFLPLEKLVTIEWLPRA